MEYIYQRVRDIHFVTNTPERRAFLAHLLKVAEALHDIEWVDSGDYSFGDEHAAILDCIGQSAVLAQTIKDAKIAAKELAEQLALAKTK